MEIKVLHLNINGLLQRHQQLKKVIALNDIDIAMINEVRTKKPIVFEGFKCLREDRPPGKSGGGVMMLIKEGIEFEECQFQSALKNEMVGIVIKLDDQNDLILATIYCPPNKNIDKELFENIATTYSNFLITGDLNAHCLEFGGSRDNQRGKALKEFISSYKIDVKNSGMVTHKKGGCLDYILVSSVLTNIVSTPKLGDNESDNCGSDHKAILFNVDLTSI